MLWPHREPLPARTNRMFDSHGTTEVLLDPPLIRVRAAGRFNLAGCKRFCEKVGAAVREMGESPFGMLIDNLDFEGGTPDAYAELDRFNAWLNTRPMVAKAMVVRSDVLLSIMDQLAPSRRQQNIQGFGTLAEGERWLLKELAAAARRGKR